MLHILSCKIVNSIKASGTDGLVSVRDKAICVVTECTGRLILSENYLRISSKNLKRHSFPKIELLSDLVRNY